MRRGVALLLLLLLAAGAGCSRTSNGSTSGPGKVPSAQEFAYGRAPVAGGGIKYKSDVVLVGGGAGVVRGVSGDSMTWSIDAKAAHLDELKPGKVMFLTGKAVGRVLNLERQGDIVKVTLGPVDLADVISDGNIKVKAPIDVKAMTFQTYPNLPGLADPPSTGTSNRPAPTWDVTTAAYTAGPDGDSLPPPSKGSSVEATVGPFAAEVGRKVTGDQSEFSLKLGYSKNGVTVGVEFATTMTSPQVDANLGFSGGSLKRQDLRIDGLKDISVKLISGSETGLSGNFKSRIEVPIELNFPLPTAVPLTISIRFKAIVETAFSAKNSTLEAKGKVRLDGPLGFSGGKGIVPTANVIESPIDTLTGISVGVTGVVVAAQIKVLVGLGIPAALAGPFGAITISYGLTNGSAIGIVQCKQATLDVVAGYGAGYTLAPTLSTFLKNLEFPWAPKIDSEFASSSSNVIPTMKAYKPKVAVCRL